MSDFERVQSALAWLICSGLLGRAVVLRRRRRALVLALEQDRHGDVVGVVAHDLAQAPLVEELLGVVAQVQDHRGAARRRLRHRLDREAAAAVGVPAPGVLLAGLARDDLDLARDHECGIEADAELADQIQIRSVVAAQLLDEALGAGARDGAEIVDQIVAVHADAVVDHRQRARGPIGRQHDLQLGIVAQQARLGQAGVAQPVARVRGVGDQLAQEDLAMLVERIDHEVENPADLGLERLHLGTHGSSLIERIPVRARRGVLRRCGSDVGRRSQPFKRGGG